MSRLLAAAAGLLVLLPATASAATLCVTPRTGCAPAQTYGTLQAAIDVADDATDADTILLGAATYTAPTAAGFVYAGAGPIELAGEGRQQTILTTPSGAAAGLEVVETQDGSIHDLKVIMGPDFAADAIGLQTGVDAHDVIVTESPTQSAYRIGVRLTGGAGLDDADISLSSAGGNQALIVGQTAIVTDTTVLAASGVYVPGPAAGTVFDRVRIAVPAEPFTTEAAATTLRNSVVETFAGGVGVVSAAAGMTVANCTIVGPRSGVASTGLRAFSYGNPVSLTAVNTVVRGFTTSVQRLGNASTADVSVSYSDIDTTTATGSGGGATTFGAGNILSPTAGFVDYDDADLRPRFSSEVVDAGDPATVTTGQTDVTGAIRSIDGDGLSGARVDIGAFEYRRQGPEPDIDGPAAGAIGEQLSWTATAQDPDPGETDGLTFAWAVDGGSPQPGASLQHTFSTAGNHQLVLTVTDAAGVATALEFPVAIAAPPADPPPAGPPAATPAPVIGPGPVAETADLLAPWVGRLRVRRTVLRFTVSEPGRVVVRLRRRGATRSRTVRRTVTEPGLVRVRLGKHAPGRYRVVVVAIDAAGNRSAARALRFRRR